MRAALLAWYDANRRALPWRETRDPYAIWVSEIMLQQTRVETVIPYYERFMARFPTTASLAEASQDDVLSYWSGLGYYRRARLLHEGVREVVARYGGAVPEDPADRRSLPGVGRYTAGAIGSIAFGRAEPLVDGNVARVLARVHAIDTPLGQKDTERALWSHAEALVLGERPGDLNQALMELGATVCTPKRPTCLVCPWRAECRARAEGRTDALPVPKPKKAPKPVRCAAVVATKGATEIAMLRGEAALFGGLWGVPMAEGEGRAAAERALTDAGVSGRLAAASHGELVHVLSHRVLEVTLWRATHARVKPPAELKSDAQRASVGVSTLTRKIIEASER
ncbi:MAG: A/G-specific adenine glycosylase [Sandaracinaceae bacterium]